MSQNANAYAITQCAICHRMVHLRSTRPTNLKGETAWVCKVDCKGPLPGGR